MPSQDTTLTLPTGAEVHANLWSPSNSDGQTRLSLPIALHSTQDDAEHWSTFAESMSKDRLIYGLCDLTPNLLLQSMWTIGEPSILITQGSQPGDAGIQVASIARGTVVALALVDYHLSEDSPSPINRFACPSALIRGRQSEISDHTQAVAARDFIGNRCRLIELENCENRAAESCPQDFEAAIRWLIDSGSDDA